MKVITDWILSREFLGTVMVIIVAAIAFIAIQKFFNRVDRLKGKANEKSSANQIIYSILRFGLLLAAILIILQINGVNITSMIAGLGIVSAIVGLALQDVLKDVIMGMHVASDQFFKVGDWVRYNGIDGKVISFNLKTTKIMSYDGSVLSVCNRDICEIVKLSTLTFLTVPVPYDVKTEDADDVLSDATERIKLLKGVDNCAFKGITEFAASAIMYEYYVYCDRDLFLDVRRAILHTVKECFDEANIKIPFNQLDVHIDNK